jgi:hypothetical protein
MKRLYIGFFLLSMAFLSMKNLAYSTTNPEYSPLLIIFLKIGFAISLPIGLAVSLKNRERG